MADEMKIADVAAMVTQMLSDDRVRMGLFSKIDEASECVFEPDAAIRNLPWVKDRHYGMTDISDSIETGTRTFATLMPQIEIAPLNDEQAEYERTDMAEQAMMWEFERMNHIGKKSIHEQIMEDGMRYHAVAFQTEYLPYHFKDVKRDGRIKAMLRARSLNWTRHHPGTVHSRESKYGLEAVAKVCSYNIQTLMEDFGMENPGVRKLLEKHRNAKQDELLRTKYVLVDYMDWTNRVQFAVENPSESVPAVLGQSDIVFMNEKHGLPFIPWVIVDKGDPIWKAILLSGHWDNMQYMNLIKFAKSIETATRPDMMFWTPDGQLKNIWLDYSSPTSVGVGPLDGSRREDIPPKQLDPQFEAMFQEMQSKAASSTVSNVLRDVGRFANTPFASVNQMINLALGQLSRAKNAAGDAEAAGIYQAFEWISHSGIPYNAYRPRTTDSKIEGNEARGKGGQITISPKNAPTLEAIQAMSPQEQSLLARTVYYDLEALYIRVNLQSSNTADEQSRLNVIINAKDKLGLSDKIGFERMGWGDIYDINRTQRLNEVMEDKEMQNALFAMDEQVKKQMRDEITQQIQSEQEAAAKEQAKSQQAQINQQSGGSQPTTQGLDMRQGGNPQALAAPQNTREMVRGQSNNGGQVVR